MDDEIIASPLETSYWQRFKKGCSRVKKLISTPFKYIGHSRLFYTSLKQDNWKGFFNQVGVITLPVPIIFTLTAIHAYGITTSVPVLGNFHALDFTGAWLLGDFFVILAIMRYHCAMVRRMGYIFESFAHQTPLDNPLNRPQPTLTFEPEFALTNTSIIKRTFYNLINYLFNCSNRHFFMRIMAITGPILMYTMVTSKGLPGNFPVIPDVSQFGAGSFLYITFQMYAILHYTNAFTDRLCAWPDVLMNKKNLFQFSYEIADGITHPNNELKQLWRKNFISIRRDLIKKSGIFRLLGNGIGLIASLSLGIIALSTSYFSHNGTSEKLPALGDIAYFDNPFTLEAIALYYVTLSTFQRIGQYIDAWRYHKGPARWRQTAARFSTPPYLLAAILISMPFSRNKNLNQVDLFSDVWKVSFFERLSIELSTGLNFGLPLGTRFMAFFDFFKSTQKNSEENNDTSTATDYELDILESNIGRSSSSFLPGYTHTTEHDREQMLKALDLPDLNMGQDKDYASRTRAHTY